METQFRRNEEHRARFRGKRKENRVARESVPLGRMGLFRIILGLLTIDGRNAKGVIYS